jgi:hypothetical protein
MLSLLNLFPVTTCRVPRIATYFWTDYSGGLRMQEGLNLQVGAIDTAAAW